MEYKQPIMKTEFYESEEHRQMRRVAFFAIVISTAAVIASVVTLPMLYSYVANFQSHLITETDFCKTRSRDMWTEMSIIHSHSNTIPLRLKRQYGSSPQPAGYGPALNSEPAGCCNCQQGPPGKYSRLKIVFEFPLLKCSLNLFSLYFRTSWTCWR